MNCNDTSPKAIGESVGFASEDINGKLKFTIEQMGRGVLIVQVKSPSSVKRIWKRWSLPFPANGIRHRMVIAVLQNSLVSRTSVLYGSAMKVTSTLHTSTDVPEAVAVLFVMEKGFFPV